MLWHTNSMTRGCIRNMAKQPFFSLKACFKYEWNSNMNLLIPLSLFLSYTQSNEERTRSFGGLVASNRNHKKPNSVGFASLLNISGCWEARFSCCISFGVA